MSTSEMVRAGAAATAIWIALFASMALTGNRPSLVDRAPLHVASSSDARGATVLAAPARAQTTP